MKKDSCEFLQGVAYALGTVNAGYDLPTICAEVLRAAGVASEADLRRAGVDSYDIASLYSALRELNRNPSTEYHFYDN